MSNGKMKPEAKDILREVRHILETPEAADVVEHAKKVMGERMLTDDWTYHCNKHGKDFIVSWEERKHCMEEKLPFHVSCIECGLFISQETLKTKKGDPKGNGEEI